jgi:hypothetical protein
MHVELEKVKCSQGLLVVIYDLSVHHGDTYEAKNVEIAVNLPKKLCGIARHQVNKSFIEKII